jgi:hypothetical protein
MEAVKFLNYLARSRIAKPRPEGTGSIVSVFKSDCMAI